MSHRYRKDGTLRNKTIEQIRDRAFAAMDQLDFSFTDEFTVTRKDLTLLVEDLVDLLDDHDDYRESQEAKGENVKPSAEDLWFGAGVPLTITYEDVFAPYVDMAAQVQQDTFNQFSKVDLDELLDAYSKVNDFV